MSRSRLVTPTLSSGADDKLATVDAYTQEESTVINDIPDIIDQHELTKLKSLSTRENTPVISMSKNLDGSVAVDKDSLLSGVLSSNSGLVGAIKTLPDKVQSSITMAKGATKILATVNNVTRIVNGANLSTLNGVANVINSLTNSALPIQYKDVSGLANVSANLIRTADRLSIPKSFSAFSSTINNVEVMTKATRDLSPYIVNSSSTGLLGDVANTQYGPQLVQETPDFLEQYAVKYTLPKNSTNQFKVDEYNSISDSFYKVDSTWGMCKRADSSVVNAKVTSKSSSDFLSILKAAAVSGQSASAMAPSLSKPTKAPVSTIEKVKYAASLFSQSTNAYKELKRSFPMALFK